MIYGIGAQALGEQLTVSEDEASVFMESFKAKFTGNADDETSLSTCVVH